MSTKTKTFFVGGGIVIVGVLLAAYFWPSTEEAKSPCSSEYDPDSIATLMFPDTDAALTRAGENDRLCVFCIIPCDPEAEQGSCSDEQGYNANYSISEASGTLTITISPTSETVEGTSETKTIIEYKKLPVEWEDLGNFHLLMFQVIHRDGRDQNYNVQITAPNVPNFNVILTVPAS